jgi:LmbE family N-acetylglucosaminyl deacetylase
MRRHFLRALVVAPHSDDEVLGAGIWMTRHAGSEIYIAHLTDGSPYDLADAHAVGLSTREEYATARRAEFLDARKLLAVPEAHCLQFPFVDQELWRNLPDLVRELERLLAMLKPDLVLFPAYEGGHPDHDAAAFAVSLASRAGAAFEAWEFPLYHAASGGEMIAGRFVEGVDRPAGELISFSSQERDLKRKMVESFSTQLAFLRNFPLEEESFRLMPAYDFTRPPHSGSLLYEQWGWGITGEAWRQRAKAAEYAII